ncbi:Uncharacterised protein [Mycobacteroides abscessus subsp. abscessus]|nr:Uncharacterised protein [Mycobacteroides abscessus subsp. abscessus]
MWRVFTAAVLVLSGAGCQAGSPPADSAPPDVLIAYTTARSTAWWQNGTAGLTLLRGDRPTVTWNKDVGASRFGGVGVPAFTADGRFAFAGYEDEQAGRYPYDGGDVHAAVVSIDVAGGQARETPIAARSRAQGQKPGRPGPPYALGGSTVVWQDPPPPDAPDGEVRLMQLDLGAKQLEPQVLRVVRLPQRSAEQRTRPDGDSDFVGNVVAAGGGRVVIAKRYEADTRIQADRLFLIDADGAVHELSRTPTKYWVKAVFSPDGSRLAYETGRSADVGSCDRHQVTVFDTSTAQPAPEFPVGPFDATPRPYFYSSNEQGALWWTPEGKLRATGSAEACPAKTTGTTPDVGVWELHGAQWVQIDPPGTLRDYPLPHGKAAVIKKRDLPAEERQPGKPDTVTSLFIRTNGRLDRVADVEASRVAVPAAGK